MFLITVQCFIHMSYTDPDKNILSLSQGCDYDWMGETHHITVIVSPRIYVLLKGSRDADDEYILRSFSIDTWQ